MTLSVQVCAVRNSILESRILVDHHEDAVLQRLAPSLAPYTGCDIIDINPGVGLFSNKIHQLLKPKNHILVEPKFNHYEQFLQPLLQSFKSCYQVRDWPEEYRWDPETYTDQGLISSGGSRLDSVQSTETLHRPTLIIGNIASVGKSDSRSRSHVSSRAFDFARNARQSLKPESNVQPRLLLWMKDADSKIVLPRTVQERGKLACLLEAYSRVEQITGFPDRLGLNTAKREDALNTVGRQRVAASMKKNGISFPPERGDAEEQASLGVGTTSREWHRELQELEAGFKARTLSQFIGFPPGPLERKIKGKSNQSSNDGTDVRQYTPEYQKLLRLRCVLASENSKGSVLQELLRQQAEIDSLDLRAHRDGIEPEEKALLLQQVDEKGTTLSKQIHKLREAPRKSLMLLDDERRAFHMDPPLLLWDRRLAEPLHVHEDDFFPHGKLALMDFRVQEDGPDEHLQPTTTEQDMYFDAITTSLLSYHGPMTLRNLETLSPGAYKALAGKAASAQDPRRGGRRNVDTVRTRTMTPAVFRELAVAWDEWLFKPDISGILHQVESEPLETRRKGGPASRGME